MRSNNSSIETLSGISLMDFNIASLEIDSRAPIRFFLGKNTFIATTKQIVRMSKALHLGALNAESKESVQSTVSAIFFNTEYTEGFTERHRG